MCTYCPSLSYLEISRSKVKILEKVFNLYSLRIIRRIFISFFFFTNKFDDIHLSSYFF